MSGRPLKIALVRQRYNPFGGAERFVERALDALRAEGAEISLITRSWQGAANDGLHQVICDPSYSRLFGGRAARDRSFAEAAAQAMAAGAYDITQAHERIPGAMIFRAGDGVHAAWLAHRRPTLSATERLAEALSPYHRYVLGAEAAMFAHPALCAVICNSQMVADEVAQHYGVATNKLRVIYNGVDGDDFSPALRERHRAALRRELGIADTAPVLLFVGSGFARKGVPQLLAAFAALRRDDARLVVVGADRHLKRMRKLAERLGIGARVLFTGGVKDVRPYYGIADALVLPTLYDPCPNAALEALSCGLPLLTSTTCGAREWVSEGVNGWVIDALDVPELAVRLDDLCRLAGEAAARDAARQAVNGLTLPAMAARLLSLYRQLAAEGRTKSKG